ncbi:mitochondrial distribution/morphology family 35/apoptosis [Tuber indicum]|nr:mitochondrial distribution/morphology family 35/apoptosis [Tuber indicum]
MSSSLAPECSEKKERYDTCFIKWYSEKYLRGEGSTDECEELFKEYKSCLNAALKQKGIHNMIEEARKTSPNNDNVKGSK